MRIKIAQEGGLEKHNHKIQWSLVLRSPSTAFLPSVVWSRMQVLYMAVLWHYIECSAVDKCDCHSSYSLHPAIITSSPALPLYPPKLFFRGSKPAGSPLPHSITRATNQFVHIRTKSLPPGAFPADSPHCCPAACVSYIYLEIYFSLVFIRANEESSASPVPRSEFGSTQQVTGKEGKESNNFLLAWNLLCVFLQDWTKDSCCHPIISRLKC